MGWLADPLDTWVGKIISQKARIETPACRQQVVAQGPGARTDIPSRHGAFAMTVCKSSLLCPGPPTSEHGEQIIDHADVHVPALRCTRTCHSKR